MQVLTCFDTETNLAMQQIQSSFFSYNFYAKGTVEDINTFWVPVSVNNLQNSAALQCLLIEVAWQNSWRTN